MLHAHWHYFLSLVDDLEHTRRYVEISPQNYGTFSVEYARIILSAGSEIDVVAKMLYPRKPAPNKRLTIQDHRQAIHGEFPQFWSVEAEVPSYGLKFMPWKDWSTGKTPDWWNWYNEVKHHRDLHFAKANLECALNTVAGLTVMVWYLYVKELVESQTLSFSRFMLPVRKYLFTTAMIGRDFFCPPDYDPSRPPGFPGGPSTFKRK
jgi:hypothetical protein